MAYSETVLTVAQLNNYAKSILENDARLKSLHVKGELTGFKRHSSGHWYFSLKDENALIRCIMFRSSNASVRFSPSDGMSVVLTGSVTIYPKDGQYQLYASSMKQAGEGDLYRQFLELREKLDKEGLFARKRPLPFLPKCVGVVTSETGAALHDILTVIGRRFKPMRVLLAPAIVQGQEAPASIVNAIERLNADGRPSVLIVGRGGGSYEDLSCFNDESVARAIYASSIPVVSAVGHEVDFTIADFAADLRAPTPSAAAELCVPELDSLEAFVEEKRSSLGRLTLDRLSAARQRIEGLSSSAALSKPATLLDSKRAELKTVHQELVHSASAAIAAAYAQLDMLTEKLNALDPFAVLKRGYAIVNDEQGGLVYNVRALEKGSRLNILLADGTVGALVENINENGKTAE